MRFSYVARTFPRLWAAAIAAALLAMVATAPAMAQFDIFGGDKFGAEDDDFGAPAGDPVTVSAQFTAATADRPAVLMITAEIEPGWYVYSVTQPSGGPKPTIIQLEPSDQYEVIGTFAANPKPKIHIEQEVEDWRGLEIQKHTSEVVWYVPIKLADGVQPQELSITGTIDTQACKTICVLLDLPFTAKLGKGVPIGPLNLESPAQSTTASSPQPLAPSPQLPVPNPQSPLAEATGEPYDLNAIEFAEVEQSGSLLWHLTIAFFGGLILNLMPCVLPVIGLKVMSFVEQSGHSRSQAFALNAWYSLGILSVFLVLAVLAIAAGLSWGEQFGSPTFNIVMASIIFLMALSLLGVWEIPIPGFLGRGTAQEAADKEGAAGAFLKGVITTLLATPCIAPGMGAALGWAVTQPPGVTLAVFTSLGIGMASPYLLIGVFPQLIKFLPKPGAWMETFKQLMGFVLLGTVLFLLAILPTHDLLPTLALFTCLALACWTYSKTPLTAFPAVRRQTWALCSAITVGGAVFSFGLLGPMLSAEADQAWRPFTLASLKQTAVDEGKTVLVDFSAEWCMNCKFLEQTVLHTEPVEQALKRRGVVTMYADNTDYPPEIERTLRALGANGVPVIALFPGGDPYRPIVFRDGYSKQGLLDAIEQATFTRSAEVAQMPTLPR